MKKTLKLTLLTLFSTSFGLFSNAAIAIERWQHDAYIEQSFVKIALEREYKETANPKLVRWETPIKIYFESDYGDSAFQKELLTAQARHLAYITGLSISFTDTSEEANFFAIFTSYGQMENRVRKFIGNPENHRQALNEALCIGTFSTTENQEIVRSVIVIPVDYTRMQARFLDCIVEEITQLLGLPNDSGDVFPSIFNDLSTDIYLSPLDYILLKVLYSPRLKTGLEVKDTKAILPEVMKDLHGAGEIENAISRVQVNSLKQFLDD